MNPAPIITFQPPTGFIQVESQVAGVSVYAPAPEDPNTTPESLQFKCPQCGATTAYDPGADSLVCAHCGYREHNQVEVVGRQAAEDEFTLENLALAERGWGEDRKELHCDSCGADISLAADDLSTTCSFCGSNRVVARLVSQEALRPRFLIPFKLTTEQVRAKVGEWLGQGWMFPSHLTTLARKALFRGVYLPFWTFDASILAQWKAEVGYERHVRYYDSSSKSWKTRVRIDWRWESGQVQTNPDDWLGIGTSRISKVLLQRLYPFDLQELAAYQPGFLAGWQASNYDISLQDAWESVKEDMREQTQRACRAQIPSVHVRNFAMTADFADETWRYILLPVYISTYPYENKIYQILINGQNGTVSGQKPVAWWKVWLAVAGLLMPGVLLALVGLVLLLVGGLGLIPLGLGAILFIIGLVIAVTIVQKAMQAGVA
ncbi:MAG: zinc ribbon domain-containing protein [Anaerolineales bacterium]|nr:zinc ribbon domain-containing protein [Anaerolineales bacterium]